MITNANNKRPVWTPEVTGQEFNYQYHEEYENNSFTKDADSGKEEKVVYGYFSFIIPKVPGGHSWKHTLQGTSAIFNVHCSVCEQSVGLYLPGTIPTWGYYLRGHSDITEPSTCTEMVMNDVLE